MGARNIQRLMEEALIAGYKFDLSSSDAMKILPQADDTGSFQIGDGTTDMDFTVYLGSTANYVQFNVGDTQLKLRGVDIDTNTGFILDGADIQLKDADELRFGDATGGDVAVQWTGATLSFIPATDDTGSITIGNGTKDIDFKHFLGATTAYIEFNVGDGQVNIEGAELHLGDSDEIEFGDATAGDVTVQWTGSVLQWTPAADDTGVFQIGTGAADMDFKHFMGANTAYIEFNVGDGQVNIEGAELHLGDSDEIEFGDAAAGDVTVQWTGSVLQWTPAADDTGVFQIGTGAADMDFKHFMGANTAYIEFNVGDGQVNIEGAELHLGDSDAIEFGDATSGDVTAQWTGSVLQWTPAANDTGVFQIGTGSADMDFKHFMGANTAYIEFNVGDGQVNIEGAELHLGDADEIEFGDGNDVVMQWDGTDFDVTAAADDSVIKFGNGTNDFDIWIYGDNANEYLLWDAGTATLSLEGAARLEDVNLPSRYTLKWVAGQGRLPQLNADIANEIADHDFEVLGTNASSDDVTYYAEGGITMETDGADGDGVILLPHLDANQTAWTAVTWGTDKQVIWECDISTDSNITNAIIWAGLKLTNTATTATDNDQVFFRYEDDVNSGEWQAVSSIGDSDDAHDTNVAVATGTRYHLKIVIASDRTAKMYINGSLVETTAALTDATDFIPYIGVEADGAAAAKKIHVHGQAISRVIG